MNRPILDVRNDISVGGHIMHIHDKVLSNRLVAMLIETV